MSEEVIALKEKVAWQQREIARLEEAIAMWRKNSSDLTLDNQKLRATLAPFASISIHPEAPDDGLVVLTNLNGGIIDTGPNCRIYVRNIREAQHALSA